MTLWPHVVLLTQVEYKHKTLIVGSIIEGFEYHDNLCSVTHLCVMAMIHKLGRYYQDDCVNSTWLTSSLTIIS